MSKHMTILSMLMLALISTVCAEIYTNKRNSELLSAAENEKKPKVAITFDDGPHSTYTDKLLDGLLIRNVKATFFLIGSNIESNSKVVQRMHDEGHVIGNHTYSHVELACIDIKKAMAEINKTNKLIESITGEKVKYIRPPYGAWNNGLEENVKMIKVKWTVDPRDWSVLNAKSITNHVVKEARDGDVILMHDIYETSVIAALDIVDRLKEQGYEFVTIDKIDGQLWKWSY